ncbi:MAG: calcium-binding protein [Alphaproteobacteria bacterium]
MATIDGTEGDDTIKSTGNSDDVINGFGGDDIIDAGAGNDIIDGGDGNDTLTGGAHADTFVFSGAAFGMDTITDFKIADNDQADFLDLSGTEISDLDGTTGSIADDGNGNAVITDLANGNTITLEGVSAAEFLASNQFVLAPAGPVEVTLGIDDTFTDPGDGVDHSITGDVNGEEDTDTDTFIFGSNNGNDVINDFQQEDLDDDFNTIPGDLLDLSALGIYGDDLDDTGFLGYFDGLVADGLIESYSVTETDTVINFTEDDGGGSLTLLGIGESEIGTVIEFNMVRDSGGSA